MSDENIQSEDLGESRGLPRLCRALASRGRRFIRKIQISLSADRYATKENYVSAHPEVEWWEGHLNHTLFREAASGLVPLGNVVDLGCNHGANSILMARQGYDVTGVDLNAEALEVAGVLRDAEPAEVARRLRFVQSRLDVMPFPAGVFDGGFMIEVLEHIYPGDRPAIFAEILRVLKPGARLLLTTPFEHAYDDGMHHVDFFDQVKLRFVLEDLGLRVISVARDRRSDVHTPGGHDRLTALCERP